MSKKTMDAFFQTMAFQYKPIEKAFFELCKDKPEILSKYKKGNSALKITILDKTAEYLGL